MAFRFSVQPNITPLVDAIAFNTRWKKLHFAFEYADVRRLFMIWRKWFRIHSLSESRLVVLPICQNRCEHFLFFWSLRWVTALTHWHCASIGRMVATRTDIHNFIENAKMNSDGHRTAAHFFQSNPSLTVINCNLFMIRTYFFRIISKRKIWLLIDVGDGPKIPGDLEPFERSVVNESTKRSEPLIRAL